MNFLDDVVVVVEVLMEDFADVVEVVLVLILVVLGFEVVDVEEVFNVVEVDFSVVDDVVAVDLIEVGEGVDEEVVCEETLDEEDFACDVVEDVDTFEVDAAGVLELVETTLADVVLDGCVGTDEVEDVEVKSVVGTLLLDVVVERGDTGVLCAVVGVLLGVEVELGVLLNREVEVLVLELTGVTEDEVVVVKLTGLCDNCELDDEIVLEEMEDGTVEVLVLVLEDELEETMLGSGVLLLLDTEGRVDEPSIVVVELRVIELVLAWVGPLLAGVFIVLVDVCEIPVVSTVMLCEVEDEEDELVVLKIVVVTGGAV